jgi:cardiolipin synthase
VPSQNNLSFVDWASTGQMEEIIEAGCRVWRAPGPFDHSKVATVDGAWVFMGSSNLDPRSLRLNFEIDVEITSAALAGRLEGHLDAIVARSREETLATLRARPGWVRLRNRIVWLFSPYL